MSDSEPLLVDYYKDPVSVSVDVRRVRMAGFCGPKLSNCCFFLSIWGIVMLAVMGVLFRFRSVALIEDVPKYSEEDGGINAGYDEASTNCFLAAGLYFLSFIFCGYQKYAISKGYTRL